MKLFDNYKGVIINWNDNRFHLHDPVHGMEMQMAFPKDMDTNEQTAKMKRCIDTYRLEWPEE